MNISQNLRFLLLQVRNGDDPMRKHEVKSFARGFDVTEDRIAVFDLLTGESPTAEIDRADVILLGGSGHYSAAGEEEWLYRALEVMQNLHSTGKPTFASCWGFQAMARAMGGQVVKDLSRAEVGTHTLRLTEAGKQDPIFAPLGDRFGGQMGHEDCVIALPKDAILLASSELTENQAYCFEGLPIYCTQFHPELNLADLMARVDIYPEYIARIAGIPPERFDELCTETRETEQLLLRFIHQFFG